MLQFMRNLIGVKTDKAVQAGVEALVRWDPQSASEADAIQALSAQRMAAAEQLQSQLSAETDPAKKSELERSLTTLVTMLEQMAPEVDREKKDVVDSKDF